MDVFMSSALKCVGFSNRQPRIHQGNQINVFGCPVFEIGTTWIFFLISSTVHVQDHFCCYYRFCQAINKRDLATIKKQRLAKTKKDKEVKTNIPEFYDWSVAHGIFM